MIAFKFLIFAIALIIAKVQGLTINTPSNPQACKTVSITFDGGKAPYSIDITDGSGDSASKVGEITDVQSSPHDWTVSRKEGEKFGLVLHDADGETAYSG